MNPITIEVPAEYIGVLKLFAAKNDVRYYLNGIALEVGPKESRLVATDGHRLGVFRIKSEQPTVTVPFTVIMPLELVEHVKPSKGMVTIEITPPPEHHNVTGITLFQNGLTSRAPAIDGRFPNWQRIMPKGEMSGKAGQFNPVYIGDLAKAAAMLHGKHWMGGAPVGIGHNGLGAAMISLGCNDFTGVIMPWRAEVPDKAPEWSFDDLVIKDESKAA